MRRQRRRASHSEGEIKPKSSCFIKVIPIPPSIRPFTVGGSRCSLYPVSQQFLDIPGLISLVLDSTDWTLLRINVEKGLEAEWRCVKITF